MKPYNKLTPIGKKRRLHKIALKALMQYDIDVQGVKYLVEETNVFYKVTDTKGNKFALKICQDESSTIEDNEAEVFFIEIIQKNTEIGVASVVKSKDNRGVVVIDSEYTDVPKRIIVYTWMAGVDLDERENDKRFYMLGQVAANLHIATKDIVLPDNINPKKWDKVFYYRDEVSVYKEKKYQKFVDENYHKIMDFIIPYLDEKLPRYYENTTPQLIHADLNPWNVKLHKNQLRLLDFEEAMWGIPLHDFAIMLFYYRFDEKFDCKRIKKNFFEGYESISKLPEFSEFDIELLMIARTTNFLNYIFLVSNNPKDYVDKCIPRIEEFIEKYAEEEFAQYKIGK